MQRMLIYVAVLATFAGAATAVKCYKCWYHAATGLFGDNDCLGKPDRLRRVDYTNCTGSCFVANGTTTLGTGFWLERGCMESCTDASNAEFKDLDFEDGDRKCCQGNLCNTEDFSGASAVIISAVLPLLLSVSVFVLQRNVL